MPNWLAHNTHTHTHRTVVTIHLYSQEQTAARADVDDNDEESDSKAQQANERLEVLKDNLEENNGKSMCRQYYTHG